MNFSAPKDADIQRLVELVVAEVSPLRVVLFGSAARGEQRENSDVDLLVVMPDDTDTMRISQQLHMAKARQGVFGIPVDFVVTTPADYESYKNSIGLIYREVERDGRELYVA